MLRHRGLSDFVEGPFQHCGLLGRAGHVVIAAEEVDRGGDPDQDREEADDCECFQCCHGHISRGEAGRRIVAPRAQKETAVWPVRSFGTSEPTSLAAVLPDHPPLAGRRPTLPAMTT